MSESAEILFGLLRASLGTLTDSVNLSAVSGELWKDVVDLSFEQGVAAIAVDGLQKRLEARG